MLERLRRSAGELALPRTHPLAGNPALAGAAEPRLPVLGPVVRSSENLLHASTF